MVDLSISMEDAPVPDGAEIGLYDALMHGSLSEGAKMLGTGSFEEYVCYLFCIESSNDLVARRTYSNSCSLLMRGFSPASLRYLSDTVSSHGSHVMKLEASFMKNFSCCGQVIPILHDLIEHYEYRHSGLADKGRAK
jgi:hypothetical protein